MRSKDRASKIEQAQYLLWEVHQSYPGGDATLDMIIPTLRELARQETEKAEKEPKTMMEEIELLVGNFLECNNAAVISRIFVPAHKAEQWLLDNIALSKMDPNAGMFAGLSGVILKNGNHFYATTWGGEHYRLMVEYPQSE